MEQGKEQGAKCWIDNRLEDGGIEPAIHVLITDMDYKISFYP